MELSLGCTRLYLYAVCTVNFLSSAKDANRVRWQLSGMFLFSRQPWVCSYFVDVGCCGSVFLCRGFWDLGFTKAVMTLGQSPLAMSCGVGTSGWKVRYSGVESHDSEMAIVWGGELEHVGRFTQVVSLQWLLCSWLTLVLLGLLVQLGPALRGGVHLY